MTGVVLTLLFFVGMASAWCFTYMAAWRSSKRASASSVAKTCTWFSLATNCVNAVVALGFSALLFFDAMEHGFAWPAAHVALVSVVSATLLLQLLRISMILTITRSYACNTRAESVDSKHDRERIRRHLHRYRWIHAAIDAAMPQRSASHLAGWLGSPEENARL